MQNISAKDLCKEMLKGNREQNIFLDVRPKEMFQESHIPGVVNIPLNELESHLEELKKYKKIYIHCGRGVTSITACDILAANGFNNTINVEGGIQSWKECQLPTS